MLADLVRPDQNVPDRFYCDTGVTVKSVRQRIWSGETDNASRFGQGGQITVADLVLPPQIWSGKLHKSFPAKVDVHVFTLFRPHYTNFGPFQNLKSIGFRLVQVK